MGMGAAAFLAVVCAFNCTHRLRHEVIELKRFDKVSVPDQAAVGHMNVSQTLVYLLHFGHAIFQQGSVAENRGVLLHRALHLQADLCGRRTALCAAKLVYPRQRQVSGVSWQCLMRRTGGE